MLTAVLIFWPLLASFIVLGLKGKTARAVALLAAGINLALSAVNFCLCSSGTEMTTINVPWIASLGINFSIQMDGLSYLMVLLTTAITPLIIASTYSASPKPPLFYFFALLMSGAMIGTFTAADGFLFYVFWEMALIPAYFIALLWGGAERVKVTIKFFIYTLAGSLFMLIALIYLYLNAPIQSFDMNMLYEAGQNLSAEAQCWVFWALFLAFAIKMPIFPFHSWQPDTYTVAPAQGTMLLSGIMLKMGIYGAIRWLLPVVPDAVKEWQWLVVTLAVIGVIYASLLAMVQKDIKRMVAYSSMAHVGLIAAGVFALNEQAMTGAIFQMLSHGLLVFGLFYIIEIINIRAGSTYMDKLGGIRNVAPMLATVFIIIVLGSVALPSTSGFVGEFLLLNGIFQYNHWMAAIAGLSVILGAVYMLKGYQKTILGPENEETAKVTDLALSEKLVLYPLCAVVIFLGVYPKPLLQIAQSAASSLSFMFDLYK